MRGLALIAVLAASPAVAAAVDAEQAQAAERLTARAQGALDDVLGPGRSKVQIDVVGEHAELDSDTEVLFPVMPPKPPPEKSAPGSYLLELPGYVKDRAAEIAKEKEKEKESLPPPAPAPQLYNKQHEASRHDSGFKISSIRATVVLDSKLDDAVVRDVSQLLPQLLNLDTTRGDALSILRAPLRPVWKSAFASANDWRSAAYAAGAGLILIVCVLIVCAGLVGSGRALGRALGQELASRRADLAGGEPASEALPELSPGAAGFLEAEESPADAAPAGAPRLGRRFDFLAGRDMGLLARVLAEEKPEDLGLFFGHLTESIPELASRLFSQLPADVQAKASESLLTLSVADPERLGAIEERLRNAVENGVHGPQSLTKLLSRVSGDARSELLGRLAARDARAVEEIERGLFAFEDLEGLDDAARRRLLGAVPYGTWGAALRGAPRGLVDAVLSDLPEGPRELVQAAADEPQPREKIAEARSTILDALAALAAKGELQVGRAKAGGDFV
ncbi:MAG TPA: FliG C-terminal domain-containing protein [Elusimicrobiota bacterium]|nr:FliG C-terminal domain-containing protein [Elusimicrobiota bacterium]